MVKKMKLTKEQKKLLGKIEAPFLDSTYLDDKQVKELCYFITDYVALKETSHNDVSHFGEQLLDIHADLKS